MDDYISDADTNAIKGFEQLCAVFRKAKLKFGKMKVKQDQLFSANTMWYRIRSERYN